MGVFWGQGSVAAEEAMRVSLQDDGGIRMENALVSLSWTMDMGGDVGRGNGISALYFKPTGFEMVDVLYGQTDYLAGHLFGEIWDPVEMKGLQAGRVQAGSLYTPERLGVSKDGSLALMEQVSEGPYRISRAAILRRDLSTVEVRYRLRNVDAAPAGFSLRLHNVLSPSARGKTRNARERVQLLTTEGPLALDQSLSLSEFKERYKGEKYFLPAWSAEPARWWVSGEQPTPPLAGLWALWTGGEGGDGMAFLFGEDALVGYYNSPGSTIEAVLKAQVLRPGEEWTVVGYAAPFTGLPPNATPVAVNPLYLSLENISVTSGKLTGKILPFFEGTLKVVDEAGKSLAEFPAAPTRPLVVNGRIKAQRWAVEAYDRQGTRIGRVEAGGAFVLSEADVPNALPRPSATSETVWWPEKDRIGEFLKDGDLVVYCDWKASDAEKVGARRIAKKLGLGLMETPPRQRAILVGNPSTSDLLRDLGKFKGTFSSEWPGAGKGAILLHENIELTRAPGLVIGGSDAEGAIQSIQQFEKSLAHRETPSGFALRAADASLAVYPYSPLKGNAAIRVHAACGEYEPAQVLIKAYDALRDVSVSVSPLIHAESGKELKGAYLTPYRKDRGPVWVRWVEYYPLDPGEGRTGLPDPLVEKPVVDIPSGTTRALWLTFIIPQDAPAGDYSATLTVSANGERKELPIALTVWDFEIPREGIKGEPYMSYQAFPPDDKRWLRPHQVRDLTQNLVEHGMRVLHVGENDDGLFRWHFDPEGKIQPNDWLTVSDDGKVALDASAFDERIEQIDAAAKPFAIEYLVPLNPILNWPEGLARFGRIFPDRFKDLPKREGHPYSGYHTQEMLTLLKKHLEKKGWLDRVTVKIGDEPPGFRFWWEGFTQAARAAGMPFATCLNSVRWDEVEVALGSPMRWIQPLYMHYDKDFFERARQAGMRVSWYNCGPPPQNSAQTPAATLRAYLWQGAKADLDAIAWWGIQNWNHHSHHALWHDRHSHWDSLTYPEHPRIAPWRADGKGRLRDASPLDSRRWEQIRDGLEDSAYVKLLRERIAAAKKRGEHSKAEKAQAVLDGIWKDVFPTLNDYHPSFEEVMDSRRKVAEAILELGEENTHKDNK